MKPQQVPNHLWYEDKFRWYKNYLSGTVWGSLTWAGHWSREHLRSFLTLWLYFKLNWIEQLFLEEQLSIKNTYTTFLVWFIHLPRGFQQLGRVGIQSTVGRADCPVLDKAITPKQVIIGLMMKVYFKQLKCQIEFMAEQLYPQRRWPCLVIKDYCWNQCSSKAENSEIQCQRSTEFCPVITMRKNRQDGRQPIACRIGKSGMTTAEKQKWPISVQNVGQSATNCPNHIAETSWAEQGYRNTGCVMESSFQRWAESCWLLLSSPNYKHGSVKGLSILASQVAGYIAFPDFLILKEKYWRNRNVLITTTVKYKDNTRH